MQGRGLNCAMLFSTPRDQKARTARGRSDKIKRALSEENRKIRDQDEGQHQSESMVGRIVTFRNRWKIFSNSRTIVRKRLQRPQRQRLAQNRMDLKQDLHSSTLNALPQ